MDGIVERIGMFAVVGLFSGFVSGLFGIGGGIVLIPLFVYLLPLFGVAQPVVMHLAVGTSMALVLPSARASTRKQLALGNLELAFFRTWAVGIFVGVLIGTALLPYTSTEILQVIFALFMLTVGVYEGFLKDRLVIAPAAPHGAVKLGVAAAIGCLAALTGTGGEPMVTPILQAFSVRLEAAIATASATGLVTGTVATIGAVVGGWHTLNLPGVFPGLRLHPRHFCRDAADHHDHRPDRRARRPSAERGVAAPNFTVLLFVIAIDLIRKLVS